MAKCGGIVDVNSNSPEIENLARFAVDEHNKKENTHLEFVMVLKAQKQVVAGFMYYLTLEAKDGGKKKAYEAKIWKKIMDEGNELQKFEPIDDATSASSA